MANTYFQFKKFTVHHGRCAMKVGTDGVLLGAWTDTAGANKILDVGTGTGLIALMLAQRSTASIDAIDIDPAACDQAEENIAGSPFSGQIRIFNDPLEVFRTKCGSVYDLIVSNPPYFTQSLKSPEKQRNTARHDDSLPLEKLIRDATALLSEKGRISLILPVEQEIKLMQAAKEYQLFITRKTEVIPVTGGNTKRILIELSAICNPGYQPDQLTIEEQRHQYTPGYIALTKEYYLNI